MSSGFAVIISAPSGTGKSTVCRRLLQHDKSIRYSISCTTRPPRPGEKNGRDYFFLGEEDFKKKIRQNEFLEWAMVHGHYYGTPKQAFDARIAAGNILLLAIDVQGAKSICRKRPDSVTIFLMPPDWSSLKARLKQRKHEARETLQRRLSNAPGELAQARQYDYLVVNDDLETAVSEVESIIKSERLKTDRQDMSSFHVPTLAAAGRRG